MSIRTKTFSILQKVGRSFMFPIALLFAMGVAIGMAKKEKAVAALSGAIGTLVYKSGYAGTCIYGFVEHILLPFGLHHVFYTPFWYTGMGGEAMVDGVMIQGAQNIFFAELASKEISHFSVSATRFMSGEFPYMIFGLPGAALAMYVTAKPGMKKTVGSLLLSAAMTSIITGITEPIEFTFLFVAPSYM